MMVRMAFLTLESQQTSRLSSPTESARASLMGLKAMSVAGLGGRVVRAVRWMRRVVAVRYLQCGEREKMLLEALQSQKETTPLSQLGWQLGERMDGQHLVPSREGRTSE